MEEKSVTEQQQIMQLIIFRIGEEEFGIPIYEVQEIIKAGMITPVPDSPNFIKGLINVRGNIVAIIDVRARFSLHTAPQVARHIVIVKEESGAFGLMVDEVIEVLRIQESEIKRAPRLMPQIREECVLGILTREGRLIILLDISKVISEDQLAKLAESDHFSVQFGSEKIAAALDAKARQPKTRNKNRKLGNKP